MELLPALEQQTHPEPDATVIILHGLGADGNDFAPMIPELFLPEAYKIRFIFPNAPKIPVTVNQGYVMPAWFDILEMDIDRKVETQQVVDSAEKIRLFVDREIKRGIRPERIIVGGFSQGGAVAYQLGLTYPKPLCGLLAMSTYFATNSIIERHEANAGIPINIHHGTHDPVVPEALGRKAAEELKELGYLVNYSSYPIQHTLCLEEIKRISNWFQERLR